MERYIVGSTWDRTNRNGINNNFDYLFEGVATMNNLNIKADATLLKADAVLLNAENINNNNVDVQNQLDNIILESGTSDAEVVQARLAGNGDAFTTLKERLDSRDENLLSRDVNAVDFGIVGDGVADDSDALQAASDYTQSLGLDKVLFIPKGRYRTTKTVNFKNSLIADQAEIRYEGTGVAVVFGDESSEGIVTSRQRYRLPRVINKTRPASGWDGTSIGVKCVNLNTCEIYVPFVQDFETGLLMYGYSQGCTYNTVSLGALWDNHKNLVMESNDTGWSNQTLFLNGRLQHSLNRGAFENDPDAGQIILGGGGIELTSNNTFVNTSIEGYNVAKYRLDISGSYNHFYNLRNETHGDFKPKVIYRHNTFRNHIQGGFHMHLMEEVFEGNAEGGTIEDTRAIHFKANLNNLDVPKSTEFLKLESFNLSGHRVNVDGNGNFKLRPGMWQLDLNINFRTTTGGALYSRILKNGLVVSSNLSSPDPIYQRGFNHGNIVEVKPGDIITIDVRQSTNSETLGINGGVFSYLNGYYLGGNI